MQSFRAIPIIISILAMHLAHSTQTPSLSVQLVQTMKLDFAIMDSFLAHTKRNIERGAPTKAPYECLASQDYSRLTLPIANHLSSKLTENEIVTALRFYASSTGQKYTEYGLVGAHKDFGIGANESYPTFSDQDELVFDSFLKTGAAGKLIKESVLTSPELGRLIRPIINEMISECKSGNKP